MTLFNILQQSPYSIEPKSCGPPMKQQDSASTRWLPSRFNVRASTTDGSLILWNTYTNSVTAFKPALVPRVVELLSRRGVEAKPEGLIKLLVDRGFLIKADVDEYRLFRLAFARAQYGNARLQLFLLASEDCNFRCKYCYETFSRGTMEPWVREAVKKYLTKSVPSLKQFSLEWFGGEPLYGMEAIADIAPFAADLAQRHSVPYLSKVTTNAYLLTSETIERLFSWQVLNYQITLDGPPEHHDRNRPARDGSPTFDIILNNLQCMQRRSEDFHVMLRVNYDRNNSADLEKLLDILKRDLHGDSRFRLAFRGISRWGGPGDGQLSVCTPDESTEVQRRMELEAKKRGLYLTDTVYSAGGLGAQVCYAARPSSFIIGATGKVMKCTIELDTNDRNVVGQIDEAGDLNLDDHKMALWTEPAFEDDSNCKKCSFLPSCQGLSCPLLRFQTGESPCIDERKHFKHALRVAAGDYPE